MRVNRPGRPGMVPLKVGRVRLVGTAKLAGRENPAGILKLVGKVRTPIPGTVMLKTGKDIEGASGKPAPWRSWAAPR